MRPHRVALIGLGAIAAVTLARAMVLLTAGVPTGIDGGNWLAFGTLERAGLAYPPLVPVAFAFLVRIAGPEVASSIMAAGAAAAPGVAILAVASLAGRMTVGIFAALAAIASGAVGEAAAWGGYPQLFGLAAALAALAAGAVYLADGARMALVLFTALFATAVATSHLEAIPALGAVTLLAAWSWGTTRGRSSPRAFALVALALLPFVAFSSLYGELLATRAEVPPSEADPGRILGPGWLAYVGLMSLVPPALVLAHRLHASAVVGHRDVAIVAAVGAAALTWGAAFVLSGEGRLLHDVAVLAPLAAVALAVPAAHLRLTTGTSSALRWAGVGAVGLSVALGLAAFPRQVAHYQILERSDVVSLRWLAALPATSPGEIVVADRRGVPFGWWAEGIAGREVLFASDTRWLRFDVERARARQANAILYGTGFPAGTSSVTAADAGVRYVVLPSASAFGVSAEHVPAGWTVAFAAADSIVLTPVTAGSTGTTR